MTANSRPGTHDRPGFFIRLSIDGALANTHMVLFRQSLYRKRGGIVPPEQIAGSIVDGDSAGQLFLCPSAAEQPHDVDMSPGCRLNIVRSVAKHDQLVGLESALSHSGHYDIRIRL